MGRGLDFKSPFVHQRFVAVLDFVLSPTSVGFMARAAGFNLSGSRARQKPPSSLTLHTSSPHGRVVLMLSSPRLHRESNRVGLEALSGDSYLIFLRYGHVKKLIHYGLIRVCLPWRNLDHFHVIILSLKKPFVANSSQRRVLLVCQTNNPILVT